MTRWLTLLCLPLLLGTCALAQNNEAVATDPTGDLTGLSLTADQIKARFNLRGDGKANDTRGLQDYLDFAVRTGEPMVIPAGDYVVDQLVYDAPNGREQKLLIRGQGYATRLLATGKSAYAVKLIGRDIQLRDLEVDGKAAGSRAASGIYMSNNYNMSGMQNVRARNFRNGAAFHLGTPNWTLQFTNCEFRDSRVALKIGDDAAVDPANKNFTREGSGNMLTFQGCSLASSDTAIIIGAPPRGEAAPRGQFQAISFYGCNISATNRIVVASGVDDNLVLSDCYLERSKGHDPLVETPFIYFELYNLGNFTMRGGHINSSCQKLVVANYCESVLIDNILSYGNSLTNSKDPEATFFDLTNVRRTIVRNSQINKNGVGHLFTVTQRRSAPPGYSKALDYQKMDIVLDNARVRNAKGPTWKIDADRISDVNVYFYGTERYGIMDELYENYSVKRVETLQKRN